MFPITSNSLDALHSRLPPSSSNGNAARKVRVDTSSTTTSLIDQLVPPPVCPEYLKMTTYADLVHEQHELALQRLPFDNYMKGDSFSSKHHPDNMLACNLGDIRLPSLWNGKDRAKHIALEGNGLVLKYIGPGKTEAHAGSIRANFPIPPQSGLFYYEVQILSKGEDGYIGIGFCTKENDLERLPGWDAGSFGYHGDDGHGFAGSGVGDTYGPRFTTGDIIGCGINFADASAFYTKNGRFIGTAFSSLNLSKQYYPVVGLRTPGEHVETNFGGKPFAFDAELYVKEQAALLWKDMLHRQETLERVPIKSDSCCLGKGTTDLVMDYLLHHGYGSTARALVKDYQYLTNEPLEHTDFGAKEEKKRQAISDMIMAGHVDESIRLLNLYYPSALHHKDVDILFELRCSQIVELMQKYTFHQRHSGSSTSVTLSSNSTTKDSSALDYLHHNRYPPTKYTRSFLTLWAHNVNQPQQNQHTNWETNKPISSGQSFDSSSHPNHTKYPINIPFGRESDNQRMAGNNSNISEDLGMTIPSPISLSPTSTSSLSSYSHDTTFEDLLVPAGSDDDRILELATALAEHLHDDYCTNELPYIKERMNEVLALLTGVRTKSCPLFHPSYRAFVAKKVNRAIIESRSTALEMIYRQTMVVNKYLAYEGVGKAVLLKADSRGKVQDHAIGYSFLE